MACTSPNNCLTAYGSFLGRELWTILLTYKASGLHNGYAYFELQMMTMLFQSRARERRASVFSDQSTKQLSASPPLTFKPHYRAAWPQYPRYEVKEQNIVDAEEPIDAHEDEVGEQVSCSENSMASDSSTPALEGFPDVKKFDSSWRSTS
ncbi:hypothetical protein AJ78_04012 [Emergomyces pasteurianus Ep9510]|uniref:Uncharacterized protein n=1 Tax=Emergomyces pasteurianus Ep9510 TaxID=1447872 RepID=A0A1J9Q6A2_9EURO|nr:hypothetical protein AJ78_04012 [Emergomyces pasteurianus Ep9510]